MSVSTRIVVRLAFGLATVNLLGLGDGDLQKALLALGIAAVSWPLDAAIGSRIARRRAACAEET
ncbi:MAG TPA: hypothetical protein VI318_15705 [Baekduia sp.]